MRSFLRLIINNPIATLLVVLLMAFSGLYSARHMPVDLFPNLDIPVVNIVTHYPGGSPENIEQLISRPIENEMRNILGVKRVASTSVQGISQVTVEFRWRTAVRDARGLVQSRLSILNSILPPNVIPRIENIGTTLQEVCGYIIYGGKDRIDLSNIIKHDLSGRLMSVSGVSSIDVIGGDQRAFYVRIKPEMLRQFHVSVDDIVSVLKEHNLSSVLGYLDKFGREYLIQGDAQIKTIEDIKSLPIKKNGTKSISLGSVARVVESKAPKHYVVHGDSVPAIALVVRKQPGANTIHVVKEVEQSMLKLKEILPAHVKIKKFYDQSEIIKESQNEIYHDLIIGIFLAVFVLYFFLGSIRPTLIVALTIPITFLATITVMRSFGLSFNIITMTALILAIGMIVDDAIIVTENIYRHKKQGLSSCEASIAGTAEIAVPDASGTFTTVAAFLPLIFVTGLAALFMRPFGLTISTALIISLVLSLTLVPTLFGRIKDVSAHKNDFLGARIIRRLDSMLQKILIFSFRHKRLFLSLAVLSLCLSGLTIFLGKISVLPPIDEGALLIEYVMPPGTALKESNRIGAILDKIALRNKSVSCVYRRTGSPENGYQIESVNKGELLIKLKPKTIRKESSEKIIQELKKAYSQLQGIVLLYHQPTQEKIDESLSGLPSVFGVTIYGSDMNTLVLLSNQVEEILAKESNVANIVNNTKIKVPQIDVHINYSQIAQYGVAATSILDTIKAERIGIEATHIIRQKEDIAVFVKMDTDTSMDIENIKQLPIMTSKGDLIPLDHVADINITHAPSAITRLNGQREITLLAEVDGSIPSVVKHLQKEFQSIALPKGYNIDFTGQYKVIIETVKEIIFAVLIAIVLIYFIMAMQFNSWVQPFVILAVIPMSLIGALVALFLTRQGVDVSVGMGIITLVGVAVNNAIVLLDFANKEVLSGKKRIEALLSAASVRLRPILLTTLTTIAALLPTAIGTTVGSKIFQPFAVTVIGGLVSGVVATLIIIPTLTALIQDKRGNNEN